MTGDRRELKECLIRPVPSPIPVIETCFQYGPLGDTHDFITVNNFYCDMFSYFY